MLNSTIVSLATPLQESALAIIRLSGDQSLKIINCVFTNPFKENESHIVKYGFLKDDNEFIDEVMAVYFKEPKSFTGEDMVEIYIHGGILIIQQVLSLILKNGAVEAPKGEYSKRAFLNGKMDLIKAEAINDMIKAQSEEARKLAMHGLKGNVSKIVKSIQGQLLDIIAHIEVNIDYPEYDDLEVLTLTTIKPLVDNLIDKVNQTLIDARKGNAIKDGITTAIIGKPNVGKSSLLNALIEQEKAIVTDIPGTTRDIVEGRVNIGGIILNLLDTAGIRESHDIVEQIGINKSLSALKEATLVLLVKDASSSDDEEDCYLEEISKNTNRIIVYNKADKLSVNDKKDGVYISAKNHELSQLTKAIIEKIGFDPSTYDNRPLLSNTRHILLVTKALNALKGVQQAIKRKEVMDLISIDLVIALQAINEILGEEVNIDISKEIFSRFCLGK